MLDNFKKRPAASQVVEDEPPTASSDGTDGADDYERGLGLGGEPTSGCDQNASRIRHDTVMRTPSDLELMKKRADEQLQELASTAAVTRKSNILPASDVVNGPLDDTVFTVLCLDSVNALLLEHMKCKTCGGSGKISRQKREYGLAVGLVLTCSNCGDKASAWSSPRVVGTGKQNPFAINVLATRAMQSTGNRQAAFNDIFAAMNISHRALHTKTWQTYLKTKLTPAATRAAETLATECANSVRQLYSKLNFSNPGNIAVSYDGSWMTRGHSSHIGVGTVIELFTGLVLDYVVLSNFCAGCERGPKVDDASYEEWKANHECQKNTDKKAGEMEVEAGLILFKRSLVKHSLRYTTVLSDGDSRTFLALKEAKVYGFIEVEKEDCINHVHKRMGTALRNVLSKHKGPGLEPLGGRGRLTGDLVTKLSSYYGWALKSHVGDTEAMEKAVMASYYHITSNDDESNHSLCPDGPDSWCRQNAAKAKGQPVPKRHYNLPPRGGKALLPIYNGSLTSSCLNGASEEKRRTTTRACTR